MTCGTFLPFRHDVPNGRSCQKPTSSTAPTSYRRATEAGPLATRLLSALLGRMRTHYVELSQSLSEREIFGYGKA